MAAAIRRSAIAVAAMVLAVSLMPLAAAWTPPPPEFPDTSLASGFDVPVTKWGPDLGPPSSLLDVLPAGSPAAGDFNRDGFPDLFVPLPRYTDDARNALAGPRSRLFLNDGSGIQDERFLDVTDVSGIDVAGFAYAASWADYDNDGFPDLFVGGYRLARLFHNDRDGTFTDVTAAMGLPQDGFVLGGAWGDHDGDGRLDLLLVQFATYAHPEDGLPELHALPGRANVLLRNTGGGFEDVTVAAGLAGIARRSTSAAWVDLDRDGRLDVYVTNYGQPAEAWRNRGDGTFEEAAAALGIADGQDATCQAWEDLDRDGLLDLYVAHQAGVPDGTWLGTAGGAYAGIAGQHGLEATVAGDGWACLAFDYDNDGDMDMLVLHGGLRGEAQRNLLLMNRLDEGPAVQPRFVDITPEAGDHDIPGYEGYDTIATPLSTSGGAVLDWALTGNANVAAVPNPGAADPGDGVPSGERMRLLRNFGWVTWTGNGNYFKLQLAGTASNAAGHGAVVTVQAGQLTITRQLGAAMAWGGQSAVDGHFGLMKPDEAGYKGQPRPVNVTIAWPSGQVDSYRSVFGVQRSVRFTEGGGWQNDTLPPRPQVQLVGGTAGLHGWYRSDVTIKVTASDRILGGSEAKGTRSLRYSLDGATWVPVASPTTGVQLAFTHTGTQRLWLETTDRAGDTPGWRDNTAVFLYPIRIDRDEPLIGDAALAPGEVSIQDRTVATAPGEVPLGRAIAASPVGLASPAVAPPEVRVVLDGAVGSDGRQTISAAVDDAGSGVWKVRFDIDRPDGRPVPNSSAFLRLAPFEWRWRANETAAGEYELKVWAWDLAGNVGLLTRRFVLAPTTPEGLTATATQTPSVPQPSNHQV